MPSKQFVSYQRTYIKPVLFQNINKKYLKLIDYKNDNQTFKTFKGIRLYDYYESDFKIPNFLKNTSRIQYQPT